MDTYFYDTYDPGAAATQYYFGVLVAAAILLILPLFTWWFISGHLLKEADGRRWLIIGLLSLITSYLSCHFAYGIFFDLFESAWRFAVLILFMFIATSLYLHFVFFTLSPYLNDRAPKYIDYVVAIFVSLGIVQAFTLWPKLKDFYSYDQAGELEIATRIKATAMDEKKHCGGSDVKFYTPFYCSFLDNTLSAPDLVSYTLSTIVNNKQLLDNKETTISFTTVWESRMNYSTNKYEMQPVQKTIYDTKHSPLLNIADDLQSYHARRLRFQETKFSNKGTVSYDILAIVAFLIATALRILKTSLELYGGLESTKKESLIDIRAAPGQPGGVR
jgi:hypothetical protein